MIITNTDLAGVELGVGGDSIFYYLSLPFGRRGAPGAFSMVGDYIRGAVSGYLRNAPQWDSELPFSVKIFVDDVMVIEPCVGRIPDMAVRSVEWIGMHRLGFDAISRTKKETE